MSTSIADDRAGARTTEKHSSRRLASVHPAVCTGATPGSKSSGRGAVPHPVRAGPGLAGAGTAPPRPVHAQRLNSRELGRQCSAGTPVLGQELRKRRSTETSLLERTTSDCHRRLPPATPQDTCLSSVGEAPPGELPGRLTATPIVSNAQFDHHGAVTTAWSTRLLQPWLRHSEAGAAARAEAVLPRPDRARLDVSDRGRTSSSLDRQSRASTVTFVRRHGPHRRSPRL